MRNTKKTSDSVVPDYEQCIYLRAPIYVDADSAITVGDFEVAERD